MLAVQRNATVCLDMLLKEHQLLETDDFETDRVVGWQSDVGPHSEHASTTLSSAFCRMVLDVATGKLIVGARGPGGVLKMKKMGYGE